VKQRTQDILFAACGLASVTLMLAGVAIGALGNRQFVTATSSTAQIANALSRPADTAVWVGAYLELLSFGFFIAFAVWATAKLDGGLLGQIARAAATGYVTLSIASLAVMDAIAYRSGHGIGVQLGTALVTLNEALFVGTWFLAVFFLLAVAPLALAAGKSTLGWSAIAIAAATLLFTAVSLDNLGQLTNLLWLAWVTAASITLFRNEPTTATRALVTQNA
jgi:hypothetical protein